MAAFTDRTGRTWEVEITAGDLKRIKRQTAIDLRDAVKPGGQSFAEALDDPERFLELMWLLCGSRLAPPIDRDEFEGLFDRDTTLGAVTAVWESTWDFSRGSKAATQARKTLLAAVDQVDDRTAEVLEAATALIVQGGPTSSDSANVSPASSALTIDRSPSPS